MNLNHEKKTVVTSLLEDYSGKSDRVDWILSKTPSVVADVQEMTLENAPESVIRIVEAAKEICTASREDIQAILSELDNTPARTPKPVYTPEADALDSLFAEAADATSEAMDYLFAQMDKLNDDLGLMYAVADQSTLDAPELEEFISNYSKKRIDEIFSEAEEIRGNAIPDLDLKITQAVTTPDDISSLVAGE